MKVKGYKVAFRKDLNVLKLDSGDGCTTNSTVILKATELHI